MGERNYKLDSLKGFLIITVVLGHILGDGIQDVLSKYCRMFIYTFHMPLFILMSGYFTKIKEDTITFWKGLLNIAIPLCIFQVISVLLVFLIDGTINKTILITPYWTLWYLLSLIFWKIILQYSPKRLLNQSLLYMIIAIVVSIFCGLLPFERILSIQRTLNFFPFFLFGFYLKQKKIILPNLKWEKLVCVSLICVNVILILIDLYPEKQSILLRGADNYGINDIPAKIYMLICAFIVSISFFKISKENKMLAHIGQNSIFYYLYHGLIIEFILQPIIIYFGLPQSFLFMLLYTIIILGMIFVLCKIKMFRKIVNPFIC